MQNALLHTNFLDSSPHSHFLPSRPPPISVGASQANDPRQRDTTQEAGELPHPSFVFAFSWVERAEEKEVANFTAPTRHI